MKSGQSCHLSPLEVLFPQEPCLESSVSSPPGNKCIIRDITIFLLPIHGPFHPLTVGQAEIYLKTLLVIESCSLPWSGHIPCCQAGSLKGSPRFLCAQLPSPLLALETRMQPGSFGLKRTVSDHLHGQALPFPSEDTPRPESLENGSIFMFTHPFSGP